MAYLKKINSLLNKYNFIPYIILVLIIISGISTVFSYSVGHNFYDGFDYLEDIYWAKATLLSGKLVNPDYNYVYIVPFGPNLLMAPFVSLFGISLISNQLGMLVYFLLYLLTAYYFVSSFLTKTNEKLIQLSIMSFFIFTLVGDSLLHHILAYGIALLSFLGQLGAIFNIFKNNNKIHYILLGIYTFFSAMNGLATMVMSSVVVLLALYIYAYTNKEEINNQYKTIFGLVLLVSVVGYAIYSVVNQGRSIDAFTFCSSSEMISKIFNNFWNELLKIFYFNPVGDAFFSARGIFAFAKLFVLISVISLSVWFIKNKKYESREETIIVISCVFIIAICIAQYIFGTWASERTLYNGLICCFILSGLSLVKFTKYNNSPILLLMIMCLVLMFSLKQVTSYRNYGNNIINQRNSVIEKLKENDLTFGYSVSFDYARQLSVLSNEEVETDYALYDSKKGLFMIEINHTFPYEREKPKGISKTYVIVPSNLEVYDDRYDYLISLSKDIIEMDNCYIYVYDMNDFNKVFDFDN